MAAEGYWRNWERDVAWLMREVVFNMIIGNPNIKKEDKPKHPKEIFKISDDKIKNSKEEKRVSPEELEEARKLLIGKRDGTLEQPDSKN
jgi:hypothetical protein